MLAEMRCDAAQGYFIARPMPSEDLARWIATARSLPLVGTPAN